jgi:phosphate transport system ATP-binding protein
MSTENTFAVDTLRKAPSNDNDENIILNIENLSFYYDTFQALNNINMQIYKNRITAFIGPSGCGKSTMLRCFNRMNDLIENTKVEGTIELNGKNIYDKDVDPILLRRNIGMVFQRPNPLPKSIIDNVTYGPKMYGLRNKSELKEIAIDSLSRAALLQEVEEKLTTNALSLSGGQQQRLCIARAIAVEPSIILMDEPASSLDPIATLKIETLMYELAQKYTIIIVTHNMQQAARVSDYTAFFMVDENSSGYLVEYQPTEFLFMNPKHKKTEEYISGRFG